MAFGPSSLRNLVGILIDSGNELGQHGQVYAGLARCLAWRRGSFGIGGASPGE